MNTTLLDMENKTVLLSGGTSGVGKATAMGLASRGAKVVILSRSKENGMQALQDIASATGNNKGEFLIVDLSLQSSIRKACAEFKRRYDQLHVLANLGGAIYWEKEITQEGIERTFAVNVLSHFLLTHDLLDMLKDSRPSRVITVAGNPRFLKNPQFDFDDIQLMKSFSGMKATTQAMNARILFSFELVKLLEGTGVSSFAFHPGWVKSKLIRNSPWYLKIIAPLMKARAGKDCKSGV